MVYGRTAFEKDTDSVLKGASEEDPESEGEFGDEEVKGRDGSIKVLEHALEQQYMGGKSSARRRASSGLCPRHAHSQISADQVRLHDCAQSPFFIGEVLPAEFVR